MNFISDKHSILAASKNQRRNRATFYGSKEYYKELGLTCGFLASDLNKLKVDSYFVPYSWKDLLNENKILLVDGIEDPRNLGSIIRSAAAMNFSILLRETKGCEINETVIRCAAGGVDLTKIALLKNFSQIIETFKDNFFCLISLDEKGENNLSLDQDKIILAIGAEGKGLSKLVRENSDYILSLETPGELKTLNASVAAALAMSKFL